MAYSRKQVVTCISIIYLVLLTALSGYASSRTEQLSVPIPQGLAYATTLLPVVSGMLLQTSYDLTRRQERRKGLNRGDITRPPLVIVANTLIFIYSTVVITLLGTHAAPASGLECGLRDQWTRLFSRKDKQAIRAIQDALKCCGLKSSKDMAWPFPDGSHDARSCETTFGHAHGCLPAWKGEEQRMAGSFIIVVSLVALWQLAIIVVPTRRELWLHQIIPDRLSRMIANEQQDDRGPRRAVRHLPDFDRYSDRVEEQPSDEEGSRSQRTIENAPRRTKNASTDGNDAALEEGVHENAWSRN